VTVLGVLLGTAIDARSRACEEQPRYA
jgi:hypothetical protein